jgi:diaminopimelate decarboxylase
MERLFVSVGPDDAGLAVAQALQKGLPTLPLTAVTRAPNGPARHADAFDDVWAVPSWTNLDPDAHVADLTDRLRAGGAFLPTTPAETHWLAAALPASERLLAPSPPALAQTSGPARDAAEGLPVSVPAWTPLSAPVEVLHAFGRRHGWTLWVRGPLGARRALGHWSDFDSARAAMIEQTRTPDALYLQRRVAGTPLSVAFAAVDGTLLEATVVRPVPDGRGTVEPASLSPDFRSALRDRLADLGWTGGGRLDLIVDETGTRWLDTWRPCFGHEEGGLARCGVAPAARLVAARTNHTTSAPDAPDAVFCPAPAAFPLGGPPSAGGTEDREPIPSLPPSTRSPLNAPPPALTAALRSIVDDLPDGTGGTPRSVLLPTRTQERFAAFSDAADRIENAFDLDVARIGLSIKTNPSDQLLATAHDTGMLAETIHPDEMALARRHGYNTSEIIVNGPVQALLPDLDAAPYALFGDAITDLEALSFDPAGTIVGIRTRPPERGASRFGVDLSEPDRMDRLCDRLTTLPDATQIGLHLHAPSSTLGHSRWWDAVTRVLDWAQTIAARTGRPVEALDLGGGWHPDDWLDVFVPGLLDRRAQIRDALPHLGTLLLEPGKALSQPLGVVISRVLDARPSRNEVILDASIAELSNIDYHPHRLLAHTDDRGWHRLPRGSGRLLGRLCMEADVLGRHRQVSHLAPGDTVVVCDAGAYDASMTYPFGRGQTVPSSLEGL